MKKNMSILFCTLLLAFIMTGSVSAAQDTVFINFPTASTTGAVYAVGAALANIWNDNIEGIQVPAEASNGGVQNLGLMSVGDAHVSVAVTSIITEQKQGINSFQGRKYDGVRILSALYYNFNQIVVSSSSGIDSINDIKGKRFAPGSPGGTTEVETRVHLTAAGMKYPEEIAAQFVGFTEAVDLMRNKQLDGAWIQAGLPTAAVSEICSTAGGKLVPMDDALIKKLTSEHSWYNDDIVPAGTYDGQTEDIRTTSITITLVVDESVPEDLVYNMAKAMWENIDLLRNAHNALKDATVEGAVKNLAGLPLHPGAEKYYKEKGVM